MSEPKPELEGASIVLAGSSNPAIFHPAWFAREKPLSQDVFEVLQKFEGTVLSVTGDSFVARLVDKTHAGPKEEAEIPLAEVIPGDWELVTPGAMFYWIIGYERKVHGQISRSSVIRFQRVPSWSPYDVKQAKKAAETFLSILDLDRSHNPA